MSSNLSFIGKLSASEQALADAIQQKRSYDEKVDEAQSLIAHLKQKDQFMQKLSTLLEQELLTQSELLDLSKEPGGVDKEVIAIIASAFKEIYTCKVLSPESKGKLKAQLAALIETNDSSIKEAQKRHDTYLALNKEAASDVETRFIANREISIDEVTQANSLQQQNASKPQGKVIASTNRYGRYSASSTCKNPTDTTPSDHQTQTFGMA